MDFSGITSWVTSIDPTKMIAAIIGLVATFIVMKPTIKGVKELADQNWGEGFKHVAAFVVVWIIVGLILSGKLQDFGKNFGNNTPAPTGNIMLPVQQLLETFKH